MKKLTKSEVKEVKILQAILLKNREFASRKADVWARSAPSDNAAERRLAACRALGLDTVRFM